MRRFLLSYSKKKHTEYFLKCLNHAKYFCPFGIAKKILAEETFL